MQALTQEQVSNLLQPYLGSFPVSADLYAQVAVYVDLLLRWNLRTNLTAIREPTQLVQRQVGESLLAARFVQPGTTVLDFGSGAGFPGIPLQLAQPAAAVTLAESQGKKASFLREAVRTLGLTTTIWPHRVEGMPPHRRFDLVAMRAVDNSDRMTTVGAERVSDGGSLLRYTGQEGSPPLQGWRTVEEVAIPLSTGRLLRQVRD